MVVIFIIMFVKRKVFIQYWWLKQGEAYYFSQPEHKKKRKA